MAMLAAFPDRTRSEAELRAAVADGSVCLGIRLAGEIVAFTWWETGCCTFPGHPFALNDDEAHLCDAYTAPVHRDRDGRNAVWRIPAERSLTITRPVI